MGMFDTIYFGKAYSCPKCQGIIDSTQTKALENLLEEYCVGDCAAHAEEIRIIREELYCNKCSEFTGIWVYIVVNRGILLGTAETLKEARDLMDSLNLEKLILWYHDLYQKYIMERRERHSYARFLRDLHEWYGEGYHEKPCDEGMRRIQFIHHLSHLKGARSPVESIGRFLTYDNMIKALDKLWKEGMETLEIYYPEEMCEGEDAWSVDVYQDEINDRCKLNWTWTVINKKQLGMEGEKEEDLPEWNIVVDEPFSDSIVCGAVKKWLRSRGFQFQVKMIPLDQAKGSGIVKKLRQREESEEMTG